MNESKRLSMVNLTVAVAALGYFVDVFDLILFSVLRVQSLTDLGVPQEDLLTVGHHILNWQMAGMLVGALLLGPLGDLRGRKTVLLGSILIYALATFACGLVNDVTTYTALRFVAGVGLAVEFGAAVTLTAELLPQGRRGIGPMIVAVAGMLGGITAGLAGEALPWRYSYMLGGLLGLLLLCLRSSTLESGLFQSMANKKKTGLHHLRELLDRTHSLRLVACVVAGLPIWFGAGIIVTGAPEIAVALALTEPVTVGITVVMWSAGLALGDFGSSTLSQFIKKRRAVLQLFIIGFMLALLWFTLSPAPTAGVFYSWIFIFGLFCGYWVVLLTSTAEMYGTNLRSTVSVIVPNVIRATVIPLTLLFGFLKPEMHTLGATLVVGLICSALALLATLVLPETFHKSMDFQTKAGKR